MLKLAFALALVLATTDVTGTWSATAETRFPSGKVETHALTFVFAQHGTDLTGSVGLDAAHQLPIDGGHVENDSLTFNCKWGNGALLHFHLVAKDGGIQGIAERDSSQISNDPDDANTFCLTLKKSQ